jgi:hypothetical protein
LWEPSIALHLAGELVEKIALVLVEGIGTSLMDTTIRRRAIIIPQNSPRFGRSFETTAASTALGAYLVDEILQVRSQGLVLQSLGSLGLALAN